MCLISLSYQHLTAWVDEDPDLRCHIREKVPQRNVFRSGVYQDRGNGAIVAHVAVQ